MRRTQTDNQVIHSCRLAMLGQVWRSLDDFATSSWILLHARTAPAHRQPTPYLTFVAANIALYGATGTILYTAPDHPIPPQSVCEPFLHATCSDNAFALTLTLPRPHPDPLLIYAAPPVPYAQDPFLRPQSFRLIAPLAAPAAHTDLTALYQARFRTRGAGSKIAVKLVGVSASGWRTCEYPLSSIISPDA